MEEAFSRLDHYCRKANYKGWDLFDGLNSRLFAESPLYEWPLLRLAWIQFFKRSPVNLRSLARVPKGYNAKGLGLFASGLATLGRIKEAKEILDRLKGMTCAGFEGTSWGYDFPWQARAFYVPVGKSNMVTTVFVANAFLDYFDATKQIEGQRDARTEELTEDCIRIAKGCCEFIIKELILFEDEKRICFAYIPGEEARVHNANMLGAALLARVWKHTKRDDFLEKSRKAMTYSMDALSGDFLWPYGERKHHRFVDNFHTGFKLVALNNWMSHTGESLWQDKLKRAYRQFLNTFWQEDGCPKYYHNGLYPIDIHCSAQGIVTCLTLADHNDQSIPMAQKIARWAIHNMQDQEGYFYCQKTRWMTNKISYIRWSQAWMFYALAKWVARERQRAGSIGQRASHE